MAVVTGRKDDAEKAPMRLLPWRALYRVSEVLAFGAAKYGEGNWVHVNDGVNRYVSAAIRHLGAFCDGEILDKDSGLPHLAHAGASVLFALAFERQSVTVLRDDPPPPLPETMSFSRYCPSCGMPGTITSHVGTRHTSWTCQRCSAQWRVAP